MDSNSDENVQSNNNQIENLNSINSTNSSNNNSNYIDDVSKEMSKLNIKETEKKNRGTGAGGKNTNKSGLEHENKTSLQDKVIIVNDSIKIEPPINNSNKNKLIKIKFKGKDTIFIYAPKSTFKKYMNYKEYTNKELYELSGTKEPDECYIDEENKIIFWLESKNQKHGGSKSEVLQTYTKKIEHLERRYPLFKCIYIYILNKSFIEKYKAEIDEMEHDKQKYFDSDDKNFKNEIIEFIHKTLEVIKMQRLYRKKKINQ